MIPRPKTTEAQRHRERERPQITQMDADPSHTNSPQTRRHKGTKGSHQENHGGTETQRGNEEGWRKGPQSTQKNTEAIAKARPKCSRDGCTTMVVHASRVHMVEPQRTQRTQSRRDAKAWLANLCEGAISVGRSPDDLRSPVAGEKRGDSNRQRSESPRFPPSGTPTACRFCLASGGTHPQLKKGRGRRRDLRDCAGRWVRKPRRELVFGAVS